jgi:flagellar hook-basal body complex protein FliE
MITGIGAINPNAISNGTGSLLGGSAASTATTDAGASFGAMLAQMATDTIGTLKQAEQMSVDGIQGKADMREVVDAVMGAEQSLQAAVAIRDKIVSAFLDISRMAI